jgi:hypothetical protein
MLYPIYSFSQHYWEKVAEPVPERSDGRPDEGG